MQCPFFSQVTKSGIGQCSRTQYRGESWEGGDEFVSETVEAEGDAADMHAVFSADSGDSEFGHRF